MTEIIDFVKNASPIMLVALCLIIIIMLIAQSNSSLFDIFRRQKLNTYKIEGGKATLDSLSKQINTIATNHLHDLPDLVNTVNRIEKEQILQGNRLTSLETAIQYISKK